MAITDADLENRFGYHPPSHPEIAARHTTLRAMMENAAKAVVRMVPDGREQSLAVTALEEAMMWANAGLARHQDELQFEFPVGPAPGIV